jgi:hypothetical protein
MKFVAAADIYYREKDDLDKIEALTTIQYRPLPRFALAGSYRTDGFINVGLIYIFDFIDIGVSLRSHENDYRGGTFYYNQSPMPSR